MWRRILFGVVVVIVAIGAWVVWLMNAAGEFKTLTPHFDGSCTPVGGGFTGTEDITIDAQAGVAYISSCTFKAALSGKPGHGSIFRYALDTPAPRAVVNVTPDAGADFCPHGISLHVGSDGRRSLFVIDHAAGRNAIEIYDIASDRLTRRATMSDPALTSPNDLVAVSATEAYITNDHHYGPGFMRTVEDYARRPWANVVRWDGKTFREVAGGIRIANGIQVAPDGRTVYVVSTIGQEVRVYDRDPSSGGLRLRQQIRLGSGGDNLELDADGSLWIGSHPQLLTVVRYMDGGLPYAPSQILHVVPGRDQPVEEVYLDRGEQASSASVGAVRGKRLLIGTVADSKFLDCVMH